MNEEKTTTPLKLKESMKKSIIGDFLTEQGYVRCECREHFEATYHEHPTAGRFEIVPEHAPKKYPCWLKPVDIAWRNQSTYKYVMEFFYEDDF